MWYGLPPVWATTNWTFGKRAHINDLKSMCYKSTTIPIHISKVITSNNKVIMSIVSKTKQNTCATPENFNSDLPTCIFTFFTCCFTIFTSFLPFAIFTICTIFITMMSRMLLSTSSHGLCMVRVGSCWIWILRKRQLGDKKNSTLNHFRDVHGIITLPREIVLPSSANLSKLNLFIHRSGFHHYTSHLATQHEEVNQEDQCMST